MMQVPAIRNGAVRFSNVSKRFRLGASHDSLRDLLAAGLARLTGQVRRSPRQSFWALRDVDFSLGAGEAMGIIGPNGAGKSTALKLLAGILRPDRGTIETQGRLSALIEVGAGFHGDLSGRENIYLNGAIMGMSRAEIRQKLDAIVEFAGLEQFLDTPVKRYSSGMYARLGFSIASHVDPDVLLVDEVLSVGDAVFRLRCMERMRRLVAGGTTLVFVTHNLDQMQSICPRALVLEHGGVAFAGSSREAVGHYLRAVTRSYISRTTDVATERTEEPGAIELVGLRFLNANGDEAVWSRSCEPLRCELTFNLTGPFLRLVIELNMRANVEENLLSINSGRDNLTFEGRQGCNTAVLSIPAVPVRGGPYFWNVRIWDADRGICVLDTPFSYPLVVDDGGRATGTLAIDHSWSFASGAAAALPSVEHAMVEPLR